MQFYKRFRLLLAGLTILVCQNMKAQELNCTIQINTSNIAQPDQPVFRTLQTSLAEFINDTKWTELELEDHERISCSIVFVVQNFDNNRFSGNFQISSQRPVLNSLYTTPVFNFKDNDIAFEYIENQPLFYNDAQFQNNLTSLITFYVYTILGMDADTYELEGGTKFHEAAQEIVIQAQNANTSGWRSSDGLSTRFRLNNDILSNAYRSYRKVLYDYHLNGLDRMHDDQKIAKQKIATAIDQFKELQSRRPNNLLMRTFFDAKSDEIASIFSGGPSVEITALVNNLNRFAPSFSSKWRQIKF